MLGKRVSIRQRREAVITLDTASFIANTALLGYRRTSKKAFRLAMQV